MLGGRHAARGGRADGGAAAGNLGAQVAQVRPGRLESERLAQRLVGPVELQRAAVRGQQPAERAPGLGVRGRQVDGDLQISDGVVDPPDALEPFGLRGQAARRRGPGRRPVLEGARALVEGDGVEQIEHPLALRARQRRRFGPQQRLQPGARGGGAADRPLEARHTEQQIEAPLAIVLQGLQPLLQKGHHAVAPIPARGILGQQIGQVHVGVVAAGIPLDRAAQDRLGLGPPPRPAQREPEIGGKRGVGRIARGGPGEELGRLRVAPGAQARHRLRVLAARRGVRIDRRWRGDRLGPGGGRAAVARAERQERGRRDGEGRRHPRAPRRSRRRSPSWFKRR